MRALFQTVTKQREPSASGYIKFGIYGQMDGTRDLHVTISSL